ncbi:MAG: FliM/FliN family flagellar motor switch protein, partial [Rhodothermales bacterium]|nr:FliM/FliN family flagellar motor switch protein [Rhodothermales bacterium]
DTLKEARRDRETKRRRDGLTTGSVVELEKLVGEPLEIYANGRLIAEGEAVVIDEQFGVRITALAAAERKKRGRAFL